MWQTAAVFFSHGQHRQAADFRSRAADNKNNECFLERKFVCWQFKDPWYN